MITDTELERLERLAEAATPGPWRMYSAPLRRQFSSNHVIEVQCDTRPPVVQWSGFDNSDRTKKGHRNNARFIAASREAIPSLISSVRELRARAEAAEAENERLRKALEPFAALADEIERCASLCDGPESDPQNWAKACKWDDLRAARSAIQENPNG